MSCTYYALLLADCMSRCSSPTCPWHEQDPPLSPSLSDTFDKGESHSLFIHSPISSSCPLTVLPDRSSDGIHIGVQSHCSNSSHGSNHLRLPQPEYLDPFLDPVFPLTPIAFQLANVPGLGAKVGDVVGIISNPVLVRGGEKISCLRDRQIRVRIQWPGYSAEPFEKQIKTQGTDINRSVLLLSLAKAVIEFTDRVKVCTSKRENIPVERGYESWSVGMLPNGKKPVVVRDVVITELVHRGGSSWQPEIWVPKPL